MARQPLSLCHSWHTLRDSRSNAQQAPVMAPRYFPSLRPHLPLLVLLLETAFILVFFFFASYDAKNPPDLHLYPEFQDVHVMVFLGFGFLGTFLARYGFSSSGFNVLVAAMTAQWAVLMNGFLFAFGNRTIVVNLRSLVTANLCAVSALVSMGVVLGKTSPIQLLLMALLEVSGFILNQWILLRFLEVDLTESIRQLHVFGTYFGVMFSWATYRPGLEPRHEKEKSDIKMDLFSMIGTLFLWMFWPSFNSVLIEDTAQKISAVYSTYFSLAASTVAAFGLSVLTSKKGKINMVHVHNATVAGGVAVGTAVTVIQAPWVAMTIGVIAGLTSTLGLQYIKPLMASLFQVHDACGVQYVHGIPGILGVFANISIQLATNWTSFLLTAKEAVFQLTALSVTAALSLILGLGTGYLLKWNFWKAPHDKKCFDDQAYWKFPHLAMKL